MNLPHASTNSGGPVITSQGKQRKRPRTPAKNPSVSPMESMTPTSSTPVEVGSTSETWKQVYEAWTDASQTQLFEWLEVPGNYSKWKCAGSRNSNGTTRTSGLTKKAITGIISSHLETLNIRKTPDQVMSKMRYVEKKFKESEDFLRNTGEGLTSNDEKLEITKIREKVISICPFYFQVKPFMAESVAINPPYIGETGMDENIPDILFGMSTEAGRNDSYQEDGPYDRSEEETSSADEDQDLEDETLGQQEPLPHHIPEGVPVVPEPTQSRSIPSGQRKERKKKPKSFQESVQDIQEQNRMLMEKKLEMQIAHQGEKLLFLKEESKDKLQFMKDELQQKYALESRRLDLEFMKLEHERQESRNKGTALEIQLEQQRQASRSHELAMQLELERLRCNS